MFHLLCSLVCMPTWYHPLTFMENSLNKHATIIFPRELKTSLLFHFALLPGCPGLFWYLDALFFFYFQVFHNQLPRTSNCECSLCSWNGTFLEKHNPVNRRWRNLYPSQLGLRQHGGRAFCAPTSTPGSCTPAHPTGAKVGQTQWRGVIEGSGSEAAVVSDPALTLGAHTPALPQHLRRLKSRPLTGLT